MYNNGNKILIKIEFELFFLCCWYLKYIKFVSNLFRMRIVWTANVKCKFSNSKQIECLKSVWQFVVEISSISLLIFYFYFFAVNEIHLRLFEFYNWGDYVWLSELLKFFSKQSCLERAHFAWILFRVLGWIKKEKCHMKINYYVCKFLILQRMEDCEEKELTVCLTFFKFVFFMISS